MSKPKSKDIAKNVRFIVLSTGPMIGILQSENSEHIVMTDVAQFVQVQEDTELRGYMQGLQNQESPVLFMKSNIVSIGAPDELFLVPYLKAVGIDIAAPSLILPDQKIVTAK